MNTISTKDISKPWEYYPLSVFYLPLIPFFLGQGIRAGNASFFTLTNPGIYLGGMGFESKYETLVAVPEMYRPKTILVKEEQSVQEVLSLMEAEDIQFPAIIKPDIGYRGLFVKKIHTEQELEQYLKSHPLDNIIQDFIDLPLEAGVFYYRFPHEERGHITSVTYKQFLHVVGDSQSTVYQLIQKRDRALRQIETVQKDYNHLFDYVPNQGEVVPLGNIGNHCKGTRFINGNPTINEAMVDLFDKISKEIDGFYYGRFDLRFLNEDDLYTGKNIMILELNGVGAEPTHVYDPEGGSYWKVLNTIKKHWRLVRAIGVANHKNGLPYPKLSQTLKRLHTFYKYTKKVKEIQKRIDINNANQELS